jgi:uncharacterized protein YbjT (DUF2867 family)
MLASSDKAVLVTGATGFIGRHLVDRLLTTGCNVVPSFVRIPAWRLSSGAQ